MLGVSLWREVRWVGGLGKVGGRGAERRREGLREETYKRLGRSCD